MARLQRRQARSLRRPGDQPLLRRPAPRGDRPRARVRAQAAAARRADGRHEPAGVGQPHPVHAQGARRARPDDPADRARHEGRHGRLRARHRPRPRREDRRGRPAGRAGEPRGRRGLPGEAGLAGMPLLEVQDVHTFYGNIEALKGVTLEVNDGEIVTLIGSNGAGKSTTLRSISGLSPVRSGTISFDGREIHLMAPQEIVKVGISQSPEGRRCFQRMTVRENLELGAYLRRDAHIREDLDRVFELFPRLHERERQKAGTMSGGEQQMLAIGRAMMTRPRLLLLDEPSMGIAPILVERIYETIVEINKQGTTILLVEQNANYALGVSVRGYVLETGKVALTDVSDKLREDPEVQKAYLGT